MWSRTVFHDMTVKTHYVDEESKEQLCRDLAGRFDAVLDEQRSAQEKSARIDYSVTSLFLPGQPFMSFELSNGKSLEINCHGVSEALHRVQKLSRRYFAGGVGYYKLHTRHVCVVLSPEDRESLLFQLRGKVDEAEKLADEFYGKDGKNRDPFPAS